MAVSASIGAASLATLFSGRTRVTFVVLGGMVALQSSQALDLPKLVYLVGAAICLAGASVGIWLSRSSFTGSLRHVLRPWAVATAALIVLLIVSYLVARAQGTPLVDWLRDTAAYGLFATVPVFALDSGSPNNRRFVLAILLLAGTLGGLSWAVAWLDRRHIVELSFSRILFPSPQLPGMLYLFALACAFTDRRRAAAWALLAGFILGLFMVTGTRSALLMLVAPLVMAFALGRPRLGSSVRWLVFQGAVAVAVLLAFQLALTAPKWLPALGIVLPGGSGPTGTAPPDVLSGRIESLGSVIGDPVSDASIKERLAQYEATWALFKEDPLLGVGPGHAIDWIDSSGSPRRAFTADTPLVFLAKFGLLGILALVPLVWAYARTTVVAFRLTGRSAISLTLLGYGVSVLVGLPLGFGIEDKGTSLALILLLALAFGEVARATEAGPIRLEPHGAGPP